MPNALAIDIGGSKIAWGLVTNEGKLDKFGSAPTPQALPEILAVLTPILKEHGDVVAVGVGVPGPVSSNHRKITFCTNIRSLSGVELADQLEDIIKKPARLDNDARCALLGEEWLGEAAGERSVVMITLGTGVGGAVLQQGRILPAPADVTQEISHLIADPSDLFPWRTGAGTVEALIGGKSLEERYGVSLAEMSTSVRSGNTNAKEFWGMVHTPFARCIKVIHETYDCKKIVVGGKGVIDLEYFIGDEKLPCPVIPAKLGGDAGLYGAARHGFEAAKEADKDWDEE